MYHLGYIVCIRSVCILQLHTRTTPPDHRARNRQNNQPDSRRPSVVSSVHGGAGWQKINCSFLQYWNYHKKSREKQTVFVWKLFCDRPPLIYLHFETDEWTGVATTGPHSIITYYLSPQTRWNIFLNQQCLIFPLGFVWTPSSLSSPI